MSLSMPQLNGVAKFGKIVLTNKTGEKITVSLIQILANESKNDKFTKINRHELYTRFKVLIVGIR